MPLPKQTIDHLQFYIILYLVAPVPRPPLPSEKKYRCIEAGGDVSGYEDLPCWQDGHDAKKKSAEEFGRSEKETKIQQAEVFMSLVVPAFNEEQRLGIMLTEAVEYLEREYGGNEPKIHVNGSTKRRKDVSRETGNGHAVHEDFQQQQGWEILVVSDGSTDKTVDIALRFAKELRGNAASRIRVVHLHANRGKGGAVTHGMRHVRGQYAGFADADGASKFEDLGKLVREAGKIEDAQGRCVAVGSRAHLVGSEAVVQVGVLLCHFHVC